MSNVAVLSLHMHQSTMTLIAAFLKCCKTNHAEYYPVDNIWSIRAALKALQDAVLPLLEGLTMSQSAVTCSCLARMPSAPCVRIGIKSSVNCSIVIIYSVTCCGVAVAIVRHRAAYTARDQIIAFSISSSDVRDWCVRRGSRCVHTISHELTPLMLHCLAATSTSMSLHLLKEVEITLHLPQDAN